MIDATNCRSSSEVLCFSDILSSSLANIGFSMNVIIRKKTFCVMLWEERLIAGFIEGFATVYEII